MRACYFNDEAYPLVQGDTWPPYAFTIGTADGAGDFTEYPDVVVTARVRYRGAATTLAAITCEEVDRRVGQFRIATWPEEVMGGDPGAMEMELEVDYLGDGVLVGTVIDLIKFDLLEGFAAVPV